MPTLKWPTLSEGLFGLKCCAAGMLAVYIALDIGLDRPFWALTTAYVVAAQPYAGTIRSRGIYRIAGTVISALIAILIVPLFGNYSFLFILAVAFWVGTCLYISMLDRTPKSYIFRLSGYTTVIIAFPLFANPDTFMAASPFEIGCFYTSPSPRDRQKTRMPSSACKKKKEPLQRAKSHTHRYYKVHAIRM